MLAGLAAAVLFGISAPLISTGDWFGSALSIAGLLYGGATLALLAVRLFRDTEAAPSVGRQTASARGPHPARRRGGTGGPGDGPGAPARGLQLAAAHPGAVFTLAIAVLLGREHLGRRGLLSAGLTIAAAVLLSEGSLSGANAGGMP